MPYANIDIFTFFSKTYSGLKLPSLGHCFINFVISYLVFLSSIYTGRGTTSFPGPLPWFGGGAGKGLFPPHPQARVKVLGTRLVRLQKMFFPKEGSLEDRGNIFHGQLYSLHHLFFLAEL